MKILVTGGAGFMGTNFILYLLKRYPRDKIVNLDKLTYAGNLENLKTVQHNPRYRFIRGDICKRADVQKAMRNIDTVVHFAAESHVDRSISGPAVFIQTNVIGTQILLDVVREKNIKRFHHISTDEVFGSLPLKSRKKFFEKSAYEPNSPYAASKAAADHLVRAYYHTYGLPMTISNCTNNYGPYQFPEKIISLFITNALQGKKLPIYGQGKAVRDYIFVEDHSRAIDLIIHKGKIGETYCLGGNSERNGIQIAETILKLINQPARLKTFVKDREGHDLRYAMDYAKITRELGWRPEVKFATGIQKTIAWYQENQSWWKRIISKQYLDSSRAYRNRQIIGNR